MKYIYLILTILFCNSLYAQENGQMTNIDQFIVKEDPIHTGQLNILAVDTSKHALSGINGIYTFSISGFTQALTFNEGQAVLPFQIDKSTFVYLKHENDQGVHSLLIYVLKRGERMRPFVISPIFYIVIPLIIIILAFVFKRFIYIGIILFLLFMYFNHASGLKWHTLFETIFDYLKGLI